MGGWVGLGSTRRKISQLLVYYTNFQSNLIFFKNNINNISENKKKKRKKEER